MDKIVTYTYICVYPLFLQYTYPYIKTPIFLLNSAYDAWQIENILQLGCVPPACTEAQLWELENFGQVHNYIIKYGST